jgi:serine/threonine-protein kinase
MGTLGAVAVNGPALPAAIGRYRPIGVLGSGAMGTVYRAHDPVIDRMVAIKVVRTDALDTDARDEFIDRFRREVQAAGRCAHASIVGVYDFSDDAACPFIVMEMVDGKTLQSLMRDPATREQLPIVPLLGQVLDGLAFAHRLGVVHRDMKPANILVTPQGQAKIADFGIARMSGSSITQIGSMLGTPSYMSPEQVSDDRVDHRADIFAVGAILYEFVVGAPPFAGRNLSDTLLRVSGPAPADMSMLWNTGAASLIPTLERALAKRREERFQSAEEFAAALLGRSGAHAIQPMQPASAETVVSVGPRMQQATFDGRFDPALLARVEKALAQHVGPMARMMLAQATAQSATPDELYQSLARGLTTPADRSAFLRAVGNRAEPTMMTQTQTRMGQTAFGTAASARTAGGHTNMGTNFGTSFGTRAAPGGIPQPAVDAAQAALVVYVGPMARVMARQAAAQAVSPQDFIDRLCANVTKPDDSAALRRKLRAEVEPKLR